MLLGLLKLLKGLGGKKTAGRGTAHSGAGRHRKPRKGKILRARAQKGIRRPPASSPVVQATHAGHVGHAGATTPGGRTEINFYTARGKLRTITGAFRMRLP